MAWVGAIKTKKLQEDFTRLLVTKDFKYGLMFRIGLETGLRVSDILALQVKTLVNRIIEVEEKKTGKLRIVSFKPELYEGIQDYIGAVGLEPDDYLIYSTIRETNKPLSRVQAYRVMKEVSEELGVLHIGTHSMRKTYARNRYADGQDIATIQSDLNHKYITETLCYLLDVETLNDLVLEI